VTWWPQPPSEVSPNLGPEIDRLLEGVADRLILIGLDGGVKRRYEAAEFSVSDLFADIDAMPMRRAELGRPGSRGCSEGAVTRTMEIDFMTAERPIVRRATVTDAVAIAALQVGSWKAAYRGNVPDA